MVNCPMFHLHPCLQDYFIHATIILALRWLRSIGWGIFVSMVTLYLFCPEYILEGVNMQSKDLHTMFHSCMPITCLNSSSFCPRSLFPPPSRSLTSSPMNALMFISTYFIKASATHFIRSRKSGTLHKSLPTGEIFFTTVSKGHSCMGLQCSFTVMTYSWTKLGFFLLCYLEVRDVLKGLHGESASLAMLVDVLDIWTACSHSLLIFVSPVHVGFHIYTPILWWNTVGPAQLYDPVNLRNPVHDE